MGQAELLTVLSKFIYLAIDFIHKTCALIVINIPIGKGTIESCNNKTLLYEWPKRNVIQLFIFCHYVKFKINADKVTELLGRQAENVMMTFYLMIQIWCFQT